MSPAAVLVSPADDIALSAAEHEANVTLSAILDNPHLPTPPALALQIIDYTRRNECSPKGIARLLSQDPGLCGKLLQSVNSSVFGLTRPVTSLERAVMVMGVKPLRSLVLGWSLSAIHMPDRDEVVGHYWQESVAGAVIARELALRLQRPEPEDDLVAGLLRDLGVLVLRQVFPEEYLKVWSSAHGGMELCAAETAAFGLDHCEVGAGLLNDWRLPNELVEPVRYHHYPEHLSNSDTGYFERAELICFASDLARLQGAAPGSLGPLIKTARTRFDMDPATLGKFLGGVLPRINEFAALAKIDIGRCPDFAAIVGAGCKELVSLSAPGAAPLEPSAAEQPRAEAPMPAKALECTVLSNPRPLAAASASGGGDRETALSDFDFACLNQLPQGGARLHGYEIQETIGRGAMGIVYKAFDPLLRRFAAVKFLTPERVVMAEARERFLREARAAAAIQHENVITIYAVSETSCMPCLLMEYVEGTSLQEPLDRGELLPMPTIIKFARQIAAGLHAAHMRGVVHRDIKPANILVTKETATIKITDFGLAHIRDAAMLSHEGNWVGTPAYMSPEQFRSERVDHRADLFALGSVLYSLSAGKTPFSAGSIMLLMRQICEEKPVPLRQIRPDVPGWLDKLIDQLHAKEPAKRPQSAADVVNEIDRQLIQSR